MQITVRSDVKKLTKKLKGIQRKQIPFATSRAINQTAEFTAVNLNQETREVFKSPTPFTQRAFTLRRSSKSKLRATVFAKDIQAQYLGYAVFGGTRQPKGRALLLPEEIRLNKYGNIPRNAIKRLLARPDTFSATLRGIPGIWQRANRRRLRLLVSYQPQATYRPRFPFQRSASAHITRAFPGFFSTALRQALRTAR